jgi:hypothetical protein
MTRASRHRLADLVAAIAVVAVAIAVFWWFPAPRAA